MTDRLRRLWDFSNLDATEDRLLDQLAVEPTGGGRAEVLTQLARVEGLRNEFDFIDDPAGPPMGGRSLYS